MTESILIAFKVASAGLYLLSFRGAVDGENRAEAVRLGGQLLEVWTGNKYVLVGGRLTFRLAEKWPTPNGDI